VRRGSGISTSQSPWLSVTSSFKFALPFSPSLDGSPFGGKQDPAAREALQSLDPTESLNDQRSKVISMHPDSLTHIVSASDLCAPRVL
jgi:hypothetical protein